MAAFFQLPGFNVNSRIDFSPINSALDDIKEYRERNRLLAEAKQVGSALQAPTGFPQNALMGNRPSEAARYQSGSVADRIIGAESGGRADATNPRSSATGSGQFINSTWLDVVKRNRPDLAAGKSDAEVLAMRRDPNLSREMTNAYASENSGRLRGAGFEATPGNTYLSHFAGPAGSVAVLKADPSTPIRSVLGEAAVRANPFMANMTAGDLRSWADRKMGGGGAAPEPQAQQAGPNYRAAANIAFQNGNVSLGSQLLAQQQELDNLAYNRQRQGRMDVRQERQDDQTAELNDMKLTEARDELQTKFAQRIGSIAQTIAGEADPARKAAMWQRFVAADPRILANLQKYGVDPRDADAGTRYLIAEARGLQSGQGLTEVSPGATLYDPRTNQAVYTAPTAKRTGILSATEQKEVLEADEGIQAATNVKNALDTALQLNEKAYSGPGAQTRGYLTSLYGSESGVATEELQNVVLQQVLDNLKATFGSTPTEGERQILIEVQGSVNKAPEVRKRILENARAAADRRLQFNQGKATAIRSGEYFQPGYSASQPQAPSAASQPQAAPQPAASQSSGLTPGQIEDGYRYNGGNPADPNSWTKVP